MHAKEHLPSYALIFIVTKIILRTANITDIFQFCMKYVKFLNMMMEEWRRWGLKEASIARDVYAILLGGCFGAFIVLISLIKSGQSNTSTRTSMAGNSKCHLHQHCRFLIFLCFLFIYFLVCVCAWLSVCLFICLSVCLSVCLLACRSDNHIFSMLLMQIILYFL